MTAIRIVEDSGLMAEMLSSLLSHEGHGVTTTTSDFVVLLSPEPWVGVEAAIIDLHLGDVVSGFDILVYLKEEHPQIRRIVLSGSGDADQVRSMSRLLAHHHLDKPTTIERILEVLP